MSNTLSQPSIRVAAYKLPQDLQRYFQPILCNCYVCHLVLIFRQVKRVLRKDGTLWLNLGDSYTSGNRPNTCADSIGTIRSSTHARPKTPTGLKPKDLCGIPWRVAFALQAEGWWLRSDIIWAKPSPMPESVTDRPTKAHEYLFLLTKSTRYFFDQEAVREDAAYDGRHDTVMKGSQKYANGFMPNQSAQSVALQGHERWQRDVSGRYLRNLRTVWTIPTQPFPDAHFATFPEKLVEPCIQAGTSERGCCAKCGAPWKRLTDTPEWYKRLDGHKMPSRNLEQGVNAGFGAKKDSVSKPSFTVGWHPTCSCQAGTIPATILDPFVGSGTTGVVALKLQRDFIGLELQPRYVTMARKRIGEVMPLFATSSPKLLS